MKYLIRVYKWPMKSGVRPAAAYRYAEDERYEYQDTSADPDKLYEQQIENLDVPALIRRLNGEKPE